MKFACLCLDFGFDFQVKTTNPKKYCVRPNTGIVMPRSTCDVMGTDFILNANFYFLFSCPLWLSNELDFYFCINGSYYASTKRDSA